MSQGKAWEKDEVVGMIEPLFKLGWNVAKACEFAGVPRQTVQTWIENDELLRLKIGTWRGMVVVAGAKNIAREIVNNQDVALSQWWLERVAKDQFGIKNGNGNGNGDGQPIIVINAGSNPYLAEDKKFLLAPVEAK